MNYLDVLKEQFNNQVRFQEKRPGIFQLLSPLYHEDGDMIEIYLESMKAEVEYAMSDLMNLIPEWTRHRFRECLSELTRLDHVVASLGGRGRRRTYTATSFEPRGQDTNVIQLVPQEQLAKLAEVGGEDPANLSPETKTG